MQVITRAEAKSNGLKRYFTGKLCKHGHLCERYVHASKCCECNKEYCKTYNMIHCEERKKYLKQYQIEHREERQEYMKQWHIDHREEGKQYHIDHREEEKQYRINNREKRNTQQKERKKIDPIFKLTCNIRSYLSTVIKRRQETGSGIKTLCCTIEFLKKWIEGQMEPWMTWENWKSRPTKEHPKVWHIDHKIPLVTLNGLTGEALQKQLLVVCHYTNLQPLESIKNIKKGAKTSCIDL